MLPTAGTIVNLRAAVGFALLAILVGVSPADGKRAKSPARAAAEHIEALSASSDGTMEIHYDYMDEGGLNGGTRSVDSPSAEAVRTLAEQPVYDFQTLIDNGPCENRIDLVFVGDGYTADQMGLYVQHVQNIMNGLLREPPLDQYASYFNVHVVEVISNESGVDEPDKGIDRDTALDMAFNDRLLSIDYSKAWVAAYHAPDADVVIALANSSRYGGAGYKDLCTLGASNGYALEVALHEFGHSFGKLADEYYYSDGTVYTGSEPTQANVSIYNASELAAGQIKWYRWLDTSGVGTYEGAKYKQYGIYRPVGMSRMQTLGYPYGPVNSEQFVFNIYAQTSPIDAAAPATDVPISANTTFSVDCQAPVTDTLAVRWAIDGVEIAGANGRQFCLADAAAYLVPNTLQTLTVTVTDTTALVRDENQRAALMTDQRTWQIWTASADVGGSEIAAQNGLVGMASAWLTDDAAYDIAPADGGDGIVNLSDFTVLAENWNTTPTPAPDGVVDAYDLMTMAAYWLTDASACDIAPPGGDNRVDMQDFAVLAAQWTGS